MKKLNLKKPALNVLIATLFLAITSGLTAQEEKSADIKDFKVVIEKTDDGIKMQGVNGSVWSDLSFSLNKNRPQAIDEYGMTDLNKVSTNKDPRFTDFLFTITKTDHGIELKGIQGTAWSSLSFSLAENQKQAIDQNGMTKLN
ncbi:hypothetical protein [Flagellimonas sp.]|uniref:hypothetical protein n=1 Tax=Flagellimonas sp. TaxID=2058762 RepID=UPI003B58F4FC